MSAAIELEKPLAIVTRWLKENDYPYEERPLPNGYGVNVVVTKGGLTANLAVYDSGKMVPGGNAPLKDCLTEVAAAIRAGTALPGRALPVPIEQIPERLAERCPGCDEQIIKFMVEAVTCYKANALLATTFLLGAASELAITKLIELYGAAIARPENRDGFQKRIKNLKISKMWDEFCQSYKSCKTKPTDQAIAQDIDTYLGNTFQFCRVTRNAVGHPHVPLDLDPGVVLANLGYFATYMERVHQLSEFYKTTPVEL